MPAGRPLKFESAEQMQELIDAYFKHCDDNNEIYTVTGLAMALDTDRITLIRYSSKDEFCNTIKKAKQKIENQMVNRALTGVYNPTVSIFLMKNNFGYEDKVQQEVSVSEKTKAERLSEDLFGED